MPPRTIEEEDLGLRILVENRHADYDVVAVHGRGSHPDDTWCQLRKHGLEVHRPENYVNWLSDNAMLPSILPNARVMRYGYRSAWFGDEKLITSPREISRDLLEKLESARKACPKRPLIMIAHSFGGLVVMQTLIRAQDRASDLCTYTVGLIFFGTPFRGNGTLPQEALIHLAEEVHGEIFERQLDTSSHDSAYLHGLTDQFHAYLAKGVKPRVACFYEQQPTNLTVVVDKKKDPKYVLWVNESAATLDTTDDAFEKHARACHHLNLNKFVNAKMGIFQTLAGVIERMEKASPGIIAQRQASPVSEYTIPSSLKDVPATDYFAARDDDMQKMINFFRAEPGLTRRSTFVVHGMGGIGKTQIAVSFAREYTALFSAVFWLNGFSQPALKASMASAASRLPDSTATEDNLDQLVQRFTNWLALSDNKRWLLIIDNVDLDWLAKPKDPAAYDYTTMLPTSDHGNILLTTRLATLGQRATASLELDSVSDVIARSILCRYIKTLADDQHVKLLLKRLAGLPLALVQAGSYLGTTNMSIKDYNEIWVSTWSSLMDDQTEFSMQNDAQKSMLTTWKLSYDQVKARRADAISLLHLWTLFSHSDIWPDLVIHADALKQSHFLTKSNFWNSIGVLRQYSLVRSHRDDSGEMNIHPIIHAWVSTVLQQESRHTMLTTYLKALTILNHREYEFRSAQWRTRGRILAHANAACAKLKEALWVLAEPYAAIYFAPVARFVAEFGSRSNAQLALGMLRSLLEQDLDAPTRVHLSKSLAAAYYFTNQPEMVQKTLASAMEVIKGDNKVGFTVCEGLRILATTSADMGDHKSAVTASSESFVLAFQRVDSRKHLLPSAYLLGEAMCFIGEAEQGKEILFWVIRYAEAAGERVNGAYARLRLAVRYSLDTTPEKAILPLREALAVLSEIKGEDHPETKWTADLLEGVSTAYRQEKELEARSNLDPSLGIEARFQQQVVISAAVPQWKSTGAAFHEGADDFDLLPLKLKSLILGETVPDRIGSLATASSQSDHRDTEPP